MGMNSGKFEVRKTAPTSKFREVPVGKRMMPAPENLSGTFQGAIATWKSQAYQSIRPSRSVVGRTHGLALHERGSQGFKPCLIRALR